MRYHEFTNLLVEKAPTNPQLSQVVDKATIIATLKNAGYEVIDKGSKITILVELPEGEKIGNQRNKAMQSALAVLQKQFPGASYSDAREFGSMGGIIFPNSILLVIGSLVCEALLHITMLWRCPMETQMRS